MNALRSVSTRTENHLHNVLSVRSEQRVIDGRTAVDDVDLLAQIGYKQELNRHYSTSQVFGISFSIMGILPSVSSVIAIGLASGAAGFVWGWFVAGVPIIAVGISLTILGSAIPTSGGLYYYTNYYSPGNIGVPLSFVVGCSDSMGLIGAICSISYGFATEVLSAVYIGKDGDFDITNAKSYGVFAACVVSVVVVCCFTTKHTATLQTVSIAVNLFLILLFIIAIPIGAASNGFNDADFIFGKLQNYRNWNQGWSFVLSWMPAIWSICSFDAPIHCSEEAKNAQRALPVGIVGSIVTCWILGWVICIVCAATIKDGNTMLVLDSNTGNPMAQIIFDALGKKWAIAFMALISVGQYLMSVSIAIAASRQIWAFARDDGLPFHTFVKVVDPRIKVPIRATMFAGAASLIIGLLALIPGDAGSGALFSLGVASVLFSWGIPVLMVLLPYGRSKFVPGPFYLGNFLSNAIHCVTIAWILFVEVMVMFPDNKGPNKTTMNYTCVINVSVWVLSALYYYFYAYKFYSGPKSNLDAPVYDSNEEPFENIEEVLQEKA